MRLERELFYRAGLNKRRTRSFTAWNPVRWRLAVRIAAMGMLLCLALIAPLCYIACRMVHQAAGREIRLRLQVVRDARRQELLAWYEQHITQLAELASNPQVMELYRELKAFEAQQHAETLHNFPVTAPGYLAVRNKGQLLYRFGQRMDQRDVFLIDGSSGKVMYTAQNDTDNGVNLSIPKYDLTPLADVWREVRKVTTSKYATDEFDGLILSDMGSYPPGEPLFINQFIGIGVGAGHPAPAVLAVQLDLTQLNRQLWNGAGLPKSYRIYLAGQDRLLRSASSDGSTRGILHEKVPVKPTLWALGDTSYWDSEPAVAGVRTVRRPDGTAVLAAYCPLFPTYAPPSIEHAVTAPSQFWTTNQWRLGLPEWALVVELPLSAAYAKARRATYGLLALSLLLLWMGSLAVWRGGCWIEAEVVRQAAA